MSTDYLSAGSVTWQSFREYIKKIFNLNDAQTANETEGMHSVRECVTAAGAPFWSLKYLAESDYGNANMKEVACQIIDNIQVFIAQEGNIDEAMTNVLQLFVGRGKLRERMTKAFQDKAVMSKAFSAFLFEFSPELREITEKLSVHPESLRDKVFGVMQDAVYSWKEEDVKNDSTAWFRNIAILTRSTPPCATPITAMRKRFGIYGMPSITCVWRFWQLNRCKCLGMKH